MKKNCTYKNYKNHPFYTEGPVMDISGNLYFTNLLGGSIMMIDTDGRQSIWATAECPNGQAIVENGDHLICDSKSASLIRFDKDGNYIEKLIDGSCSGEQIKVPNDVIADKNGNIYFTDSVRHKGKVGRISSSGTESIIAINLDYPNGLALSVDEKQLFVAESYKNRIISFDISGNGLIINEAKILINLPTHSSNNITCNLPDGVKVDQENNIWVAHYGMGMIHKYNINGELLQSLILPFDLVSNLFINNNMILVTGGQSEPGPGCILQIDL